MGIQPEGDTLGYMGDPLLTWATAWLAGHKGHGYVTGCGTPYCAAGTPRHVHARWVLEQDKDGHEIDAVDVLIAESWWANLFDAPAASRISNWITPLIWGVGWRGLLAAALIIGAVMVSTEWFSGDWGASWALATVLAVTLCLLIAFLPAALLVIGKLPGKIGDATVGFLNFLILWVGDVMVYQQNPRNTFEARAKIRRDLRWITNRTETTVVAAHSLGSLLTIDVLSESKESKVKFLATFGCPIKLLRMRKSHYLNRLNEVDTMTGWANFYDPFDFIGGPVDNQLGFPFNIRVDNGRNVLGAHGGYPDNAEQFQDALYRLIVSKPTANTSELTEEALAPYRKRLEQWTGIPFRPSTSEDENGNLGSAFRSRWWRSFNGTAFLILSLPAAMAGAYLLFQQGWAGRVAELVNAQKFIPDLVKEIIVAAAIQGNKKQQDAGSMLICLCATTVLAIIALWIGHLVLMSYEARAEEAVAAGKSPSIRRFKLFLIGLWALWLLPLLFAPLVYTKDLNRLVTLLIPTFGATIVIGVWMFWVRHLKHLNFGADQVARKGVLTVAAALGPPFINIQHSCIKELPPRPENDAASVGGQQLEVPEHIPAVDAQT